MVENAFGILAASWRCFLKSLEVQPELAEKIGLAACCCLHNMLYIDNIDPDVDISLNEELGMQNISGIRKNSTREAFDIQENFKNYFNSAAGCVPWQLIYVRRVRLQADND